MKRAVEFNRLLLEFGGCQVEMSGGYPGKNS